MQGKKKNINITKKKIYKYYKKCRKNIIIKSIRKTKLFFTIQANNRGRFFNKRNRNKWDISFIAIMGHSRSREISFDGSFILQEFRMLCVGV